MSEVGHVPYGYKIIDGSAHIFEGEAEKVRRLFENYLSGLSLTKAAKEAGINSYHGTVGRMLRNKRYLGDDYYPSIIDKSVFDKAEIERNKRAKKLGRIFEPKEEKKVSAITEFTIGEIKKEYPDPFTQAEYVYSLIKEKEVQDGS